MEWFPLDALPKGCYGVEPFLPRLHRWMAKTKGLRAPKSATAGVCREESQRFFLFFFSMFFFVFSAGVHYVHLRAAFYGWRGKKTGRSALHGAVLDRPLFCFAVTGATIRTLCMSMTLVPSAWRVWVMGLCHCCSGCGSRGVEARVGKASFWPGCVT